MPYSKKLEAALIELEKANVHKANAMPLPYKLLRKVGVEIIPFHYNKFSSNFLIATAWFSPIWFLLGFWHLGDASIATICTFSMLSGSILGLCTAAYYSNSAKKYKLSAWEEL